MSIGIKMGIGRALSLKAERNYMDKVRTEERAARDAELAQARAWQKEDLLAGITANRLDKLFELGLKEGAFTTNLQDASHEVSVLKELGASEETLAKVASYGPEALQEAIATIQKQREAVAGSPITIGPAEVESLLSAGVSTVSEGGVPDFAKAASILGMTEEELDQPYAGGFTVRDVVTGALTGRPKRKTTWLGEPQSKPLDTAAVNTIREGAKDNLADALIAQEVYYSQKAAALREKESTEGLTEGEINAKNTINANIRYLGEAKEALKAGSIDAAVAAGGAQAILPFFQANPVALNYSWGSSWAKALEKYTFDSVEEVEAVAAPDDTYLKPGDLVIVGGKVLPLK